MAKKRKRWYMWVGGIVVVLILLHLMLPFILVRYVNKSLDNIEGYTGSVGSIHVNLFAGAYVIENLKILTESGEIKEPFVSSDRIDLSVEWSALLDGAIVGEIKFTNPELVFVVPSDTTAEKQTGQDVDWTEPIKDLMPLQINRLEIVNGNIYYKDPASEPKVDIYLKELNAVATNLSNTDSENRELPSNLNLSAISIGNGNLVVEGRLDIIQQVPDFDIDLSFENVDLTQLNDFAKAYAKADIERGELNFYTEVIGKDGNLEGYLKPLLVDLKFLDLGDEEENNPFKIAWEFLVGTVTEVFENQKKDQLGTKIPISGSYSNVKPGIFPAIGNVLKNAFIQALQGKTEGSIQFNETEVSGKESK